MAEREERLLEVVLLALTPFLAFYALWGLLAPLIADHTSLVLNNEHRGLDDPTRSGAASWRDYLPVAASAWVLKSLLARLNRDRRPVLTAMTTILEAVWLFLAFWGLTKAAQASEGWLSSRAAWQWITDGWETATDWLGQFRLPFSLTVPQIVATLWDWWRQIFWPGLKEAVGQPLVWLAMAALVYRPGRTAGAGLERRISGLRRDRRFVVDLLTRDYREKYLPLAGAIRMVLRQGLAFLSALCLLYVAINALGDWLLVWAVAALDRTMEYPDFLTGLLDLGRQVLVEPVAGLPAGGRLRPCGRLPATGTDLTPGS